MSDFNGPYYPSFDPYFYQQMQQINFDMTCMKNNQNFLSSELYKIKNTMSNEQMMSTNSIKNLTDKVNTYETRINYAYKRINKLELDLKKRLKSDKPTMSMPSFMPPPMLMFGGTMNGKSNSNENVNVNVNVNELIDSEDECDMTVDVYAEDKNNEVEEKIEVIDIKVTCISDLINIGLQYKKINDETKDEKNDVTKDKNEEKNILIFSPDKPEKNLSFEDMIKHIVTHLNDKIDNKIDNKIKPKEKEEEMKKKRYYEFCGKKYNINIQKIINLIGPLTKLHNINSI